MNKKFNKKVVPFLILAQIMATSGLAYAAPDEIHAFKTMRKWDYHRTNYDNDGNIRYQPKSVQFDTENEGVIQVDNRIPKLSSEDTEYGNNIEVTFDASTPEAKQWQSNIYRIVKQNPHLDNPNSVQDVTYKVEDGKITLYADSKAIDYNGEHLIKVYSTGYDTVKGIIHIVEEGKIRIHGNYKPIEGQDLLFELLDFNYAITNPIYEVLLDGKHLEGGCKDYHVVSNLIRLENDAHSKLAKGKHTITVKAKGYKDFNKTFIVEESKGEHTNPVTNHKQEVKRLRTPIKIKAAKVDAVSSASTEQGENAGTDTVSGASGSLDTQANLVFDFDLVSNAQILEELGMETENSKKVLEIWNSTSRDAASKDGKMLTWGGFANAVMDAKVEGKHITFEDYINSPDAEKYRNRPYNVKYVLEDGSYGETQPFAQINEKQAPNVENAKVRLGKDIELTFDDSEWKDNIEYIKVGSTQLLGGEYEVQDKKIIIKSHRFTRGNNEVVIASKGYRDAKANVLVEKSEINLELDSLTNELGKDINVLGVTKDFVANLQSITLNGKSLLSDVAIGGDGWDYKVESDKIVLNKDLFKDNTKQTLIIKSYGYNTRMVQFNLDGEAISVPEKIKAPRIYIKDDNGQGNENVNQGEAVTIVLGRSSDKDVQKYKDAIKTGSIEVEGQTGIVSYKIEESDGMMVNLHVILSKDNFKEAKEYNVVIKATGYEEERLTVKVQGSENPIIEDGQYKPMWPTECDIKNYSDEWKSKIEKVLMNDKELKSTEYEIFKSSDTIGSFRLTNAKEALKDGKNEFVIKANGYEECTFKIEKEGTTPQPQEDTEKPVITLKGEASVNVEKESGYNDEGVTITDNKDENLPATITYTKNGKSVNEIDTLLAETYTIHYNATDKAGNKAEEVTRTVIVKEKEVVQGDKEAPVIESKDEHYLQWGSVDLKIENYDDEWKNKITEFIFDGVSYGKDENYKIEKRQLSKYFYLTADESLFPKVDGGFMKYIEKGTYNITIKSDGYKDVNLSIKIKTN